MMVRFQPDPQLSSSEIILLTIIFLTIGLTEPIPFHVKTDSTGLGKISQDVRMIETTVSQRRGLDSERQQKENEEQRRLREVSHAT